jgi:hypothetical protein
MNDEAKDQHSRTTGEASHDSQPGKLPYEKPSFRHEGVFETMALACGKISSTQGACRSVIKLS